MARTAYYACGQIIQDRLGFMWFGTREGLNRYDGLAFRVYRKDNSGLGKNFVTALYEDSGGRIWTGTDGGVYVYSPREDAFAAFDLLSDKQTRVTGYVTCIAGEGEEVWIASEGQGLFCHDCRTGALRHLFQTQGLPNVNTFLLTEDSCWVALYADNLYALPDNAIYSLCRDREGGMWIGSYFGGGCPKTC